MDKEKRIKIFQGRVVSDKMSKSRVVLIDNFKRFPKYGKFVKISKRFKAHDENNEYKVGDRVEIQETRPLSRNKSWKIIRLIERPKEEVLPEE